MDLEQIIPDGSFVALDFETAQSHRGICEIGIATFRGWKIQEQWGTRVNPPISFHSKCIDKHKITPECVENSPRLDDVWNTLAGMLRNQVVVCHGFHYDKTTLENDAENHGLNIPEISSWECSLLIAQSF